VGGTRENWGTSQKFGIVPPPHLQIASDATVFERNDCTVSGLAKQLLVAYLYAWLVDIATDP